MVAETRTDQAATAAEADPGRPPTEALPRQNRDGRAGDGTHGGADLAAHYSIPHDLAGTLATLAGVIEGAPRG